MFNARKATDMAIHLLKKTGGIDSYNYTKIMKLMYLAERESYRLYHEPMCGDDVYSLPHGPVLSKVADFMRGNIQADEWRDYIRRDGYDIYLIDDNTTGHRQLSRADKAILDEQWEKHQDKTWGQMCEWTHENCPEWDKAVEDEATPYRRSAIGVQSLLKAVGVSDNDMAGALRSVAHADSFDHVINQLSK